MVYTDYYHTSYFDTVREKLNHILVLFQAPNETFVRLHSEDKLLGTETLKALAEISNRSHYGKLADEVFLLTGRDIVQYKRSNNTTEVVTDNAGGFTTDVECLREVIRSVGRDELQQLHQAHQPSLICTASIVHDEV
ncbi:hypothetical protein HPB50_017477 [Hyalomma asiaticum]|uniref:Uncharacterized protein n=1 Tax=Hyalomma asiaticum TaxID=266040 RepID=A0ACB7RRJ3_HYAAI|nr:hypothetical protein HPB50_017477 [Hyalomma asiaticum]